MEERKEFMKGELLDIKYILSKLLIISDGELRDEIKSIKDRIDNLHLFLSGK